MINEKMAALGKKPSVIRKIFEYSNKRKAEIGEENVFDFSLGNPSIPAPKEVTQTLKELVMDTDPVKLHGYTSAPGDLSVRKQIAENIFKKFGFSCGFKDIYMTCGAAASLTVSLKALCISGDEVIVLSPYFPEYAVFIENANAKIKEVPLSTDTMHIDFNALESAINKRTKAIIINSPNNPTGVIYTKEELLKTAQLLKSKSEEFGRDIYIVCDEPYRELSYGSPVPYIPNIYDNTILCYSYSKALSLPGERIGYIMVSPKCSDNSDICAAVAGAGRSMGYVCAPSLMQYLIKNCDMNKSDIEAYNKNRLTLYFALKDMGYEPLYPDGAFYLFVKALEADAVKFCERAEKYELLLVPSDDFGCKGYVRIAYCVSFEQIERSLPAFKKLKDEYKK